MDTPIAICMYIFAAQLDSAYVLPRPQGSGRHVSEGQALLESSAGVARARTLQANRDRDEANEVG